MSVLHTADGANPTIGILDDYRWDRPRLITPAMTRSEPPEPPGATLASSLQFHPKQPSTPTKIFGMENFGNTCYCNSILQCLFYLDRFRDNLVNYGYLDAGEQRRYKPEVKGVGAHSFTVKYEQLIQNKLKEEKGDEAVDANASTGAPKRKGLIFGLKFNNNNPEPSRVPSVSLALQFSHPQIMPAGQCEGLSTPQRIEVMKCPELARLPVQATRCNNTLIKQNITTSKSLLMLLDDNLVQSLNGSGSVGGEGLSIIVVGIPYPEPFLLSPVNAFAENPLSDHRKKLALINGPIINLDSPLCVKAQNEDLCLMYALRDMFEAMIDNRLTTGVVCPLYFIAKLKAKNFLFSQNNMHHDAHEFYNYLLNEIIDCVQRDSGGTKNWCTDIFQGKITNETKCLSCETVTLKHEHFIDLSVDIPPLDHRLSHLLSHLLNNFSQLEVLTNQNKFYCNRCALLQEAVKTIKLAKLPEVLVINMKRFKYDELVDRMVKLFDLISYPFNLRLFNTTDDVALELMYELYALVVHIGGGPTHGHYVALCKYRPGVWLLFDDETVEIVDDLYVMRFFGNSPGLGSAYMLFYQHLGEDQSQEGYNTSRIFNIHDYYELQHYSQEKLATGSHSPLSKPDDLVSLSIPSMATTEPRPPPIPTMAAATPAATAASTGTIPTTQTGSAPLPDKRLFKLNFFDKSDNDLEKNGRTSLSSLIPAYSPYVTYPAQSTDTLEDTAPPPAPLNLAPAPVPAPPPMARKKLLFRRRDKLLSGAGPTPETNGGNDMERRKSIFGFKRKG